MGNKGFQELNYVECFNKALAYKKNKEFEKAVKYYEKAIELKPDLSEAYFNLAYLKFNDNKPFDAIKCYEKVLELNENDVETKYFLALAYMQTKDYEKGLMFYENRLCRISSIISQEKTYPNLMQNAKIWQGENIEDKTIYTYYEAGFGDLIMFSRYLPILKQRCKKIIFKPQQELYELMRENFSDIEIMEYFEPEKNISFDVHLPFLSLPYRLGLSKDELFTSREGYLKANEVKTEKYKRNYLDTSKIKIGIKWQGNTYYDTDRVINIESFFPLFEMPQLQFYSFQTFSGSEELLKIQEKYDVKDLGQTFKNFSDTAAAVENLDLVICNDTSLAHVAGALGKKCYVLLPRVYNWRWHSDLSKCDWYESVKLLRQENAGNWDEVFVTVKKDLLKTFNINP